MNITNKPLFDKHCLHVDDVDENAAQIKMARPNIRIFDQISDYRRAEYMAYYSAEPFGGTELWSINPANHTKYSAN